MKRLLSIVLFFIPSIVFSEVGFKDLKVGGPYDSIYEHCKENSGFFRCYEIDDVTFSFSGFNKNEEKISDEFQSYIGYGIGFRNIQIGMKRSEVNKYCEHWSGDSFRCYGLSNYFYFTFDDEHLLSNRSTDGLLNKITTKYVLQRKVTINSITVDLGPIYTFSYSDRIIGNPYQSLRDGLDQTYNLDWEFSERDRKLFNESKRDSLWVSYNEGMVLIEIRREKFDINLYLYYYSEDEGKKISEELRPQNVNFNDF